MVLEVTPEQLLTGKGIDGDFVDVMGEDKVESRISQADMRILEDINGMKKEQCNRLMKYIAALKQIEELEKFE